MTGLYVIAGMPRSGTTEMLRVVSQFGDFTNISEPSNWLMSTDEFWGKDIADRLDLRKKIQDQVDTVDLFVHLLTQADIKVIKVIACANSDRLSCGTLGEEYKNKYIELIEHEGVDKVILMYRKDVLRQALSYCISMKLGVWQGDANIVRDSVIGSLDAELFRHAIESMDNNNKYIETLSDKKNCKLCEYDDFYNKYSRQEFHWRGVAEFLGHEYNKETVVDVNSKRYNGPETYCKIENLQELKEIYFQL